MFKKKTCRKCGNKINDKYGFCPYCGNPFSNKIKNKDWGLLGKDDTNEFGEFSKSIFGGISGKMLNKMLGSTMKMLEKEIQKEMKNENSQKPMTNFRLMINGKEINLNNLNNPRQQTMQKQEIKKIHGIKLPQNKLKGFSKLPQKDTLTNIRRLSDKVIYEIKIPGVKSIGDISISRLEKSIEIKAMSKNNAYFKSIPINLPIIDYNLSKGKLVLEFGVES